MAPSFGFILSVWTMYILSASSISIIGGVAFGNDEVAVKDEVTVNGFNFIPSNANEVNANVKFTSVSVYL